MNSVLVARKINITGVVQGVGFRPFLFRLAHNYSLKGEVFNTASGVTLILEGYEDNIDMFRQDIISKKPPLAIISEIIDYSTSLSGYKTFTITKSSQEPLSKSALISPDVAVCQDCLQEMHDLDNRRFEYPFINCTNCGPRYTIIKDIPYDRAKTSMDVFALCNKCQKEYDDPFDRRFHAQPNACPVCGPHLFLVDRMGNQEEHIEKTVAPFSTLKNALDLAAELLKQGNIVAVKGLGGFHLAVDAMNHDAVAKLRRLKKRPHKPFALMVKSIEAASRFVNISSQEKKLLESHNRPIVLLSRHSLSNQDEQNIRYMQDRGCTINDSCKINDSGCAKEWKSEHMSLSDCQIAPGNPFLGIMLPYTPLHYLLLEKGPSMLVMTSGNRSNEPISIENEDAINAFSHIADYFLLHNRDIYFRADDSIMQVQNEIPRFFRRSRGYAPLPIILSKNLSPDEDVLGCGAGLKNTICLTSENRAFLSQHIGNLDNEKTLAFYKNSISHLKKILDIKPSIVAHDLHPDYLSTRFAISMIAPPHSTLVKCKTIPLNSKLIKQSNTYGIMPQNNDSAITNNDSPITLVAVQHHHAHAVSCMAENKVEGNVIAITLDGTGFGTDGNIWGGEILVCNETDFKRKAHLKYMPMPGGDAAVKEPWRMAVSYLYAAFGDNMFNLDIPFFREISHDKISFMIQMIKKKINIPMTSSCGRLFDAIASLCSIRHSITFESQAAMELQAKSAPLEDIQNYDFTIEQTNFINTISVTDSGKRLWPDSAAPDHEKQICFHGKEKILESDMDNCNQLLVIDVIPSIKEVVKDLHNKVPIEHICAKFHKTVIEMFVRATEEISIDTGLRRVVLSGGVFNNTLILTGIIKRLEKKEFKVYSHSKVPTGDGGIALGQVVIAGMKIRVKKNQLLSRRAEDCKDMKGI
ncbi:MAG: carbamoyltransferase HypF [Desulfamplus sp.]|nr:carbamoyltransferase HypF [Desulfamplus sp.]